MRKLKMPTGASPRGAGVRTAALLMALLLALPGVSCSRGRPTHGPSDPSRGDSGAPSDPGTAGGPPPVYEPDDPAAGCVGRFFSSVDIDGQDGLDAAGRGLSHIDRIARGDATVLVADCQPHELCTLSGWVGFAQPVDRFGYTLDADGIAGAVFGDFLEEPGAPVLRAGGSFAARFRIRVPISDLHDGSRRVSALARLADGAIVRLLDWTVTVRPVAASIGEDTPAAGASLETLALWKDGFRYEDVFQPGRRADWRGKAEFPLGVSSLRASGWVSLRGAADPDAGPDEFAYLIDDDILIADPAFTAAAGEADRESARQAGGDRAARFDIPIHFLSMSGRHTVRLLLRRPDGPFVTLEEFHVSKKKEHDMITDQILPTPRRAEWGERVPIDASVAFEGAFANAADTLTDFARRIHRIELRRADAPEGAGVVFAMDASLPDEAYRIDAANGQARVFASGDPGAQNAAVSLIQMMAKSDDGLTFTMPRGITEDAPECSWRAVMIDLGRSFHEMPVLYDYVDMCRLYKIRQLHLHFTEHESYTLPSRAFPKLPTEGRSYTEEEIRGLADYARKRAVMIVPEVDVPGHNACFHAYPEIFGDGSIIIQTDESMAALDTIIGEMCDLFPDSPYIHIGGDEAAIWDWLKDHRTMNTYRKHGVNVDVRGEEAEKQLYNFMYAQFVRHLSETVLSHGRTPVVWEGFPESVNDLIPKETVVMSWENYYQTTPCLLAGGFRILNCSWNPLYVVTPTTMWEPRKVFDWNIYSWQPVHGESPYIRTGLVIEPTDQVLGGQICAWGDQIAKNYDDPREGALEEQRRVADRIPALSENTWNREKRVRWREFSLKAAYIDHLYGLLRTGK